MRKVRLLSSAAVVLLLLTPGVLAAGGTGFLDHDGIWKISGTDPDKGRYTGQVGFRETAPDAFEVAKTLHYADGTTADFEGTGRLERASDGTATWFAFEVDEAASVGILPALAGVTGPSPRAPKPDRVKGRFRVHSGGTRVYGPWVSRKGKVGQETIYWPEGDPYARAERVLTARIFGVFPRYDTERRRRAAEELGLLRDPRAIPILERALVEDTERDRWHEQPVTMHAATALGRIGDPSSVPALIAAVERGTDWALAVDADPRDMVPSMTARAAANALGVMREKRALPALTAYRDAWVQQGRCLDTEVPVFEDAIRRIQDPTWKRGELPEDWTKD